MNKTLTQKGNDSPLKQASLDCGDIMDDHLTSDEIQQMYEDYLENKMEIEKW